jgi:putative selenium metabolism protein SsnA
MATVLTNAWLANLDPPSVRFGGLRIEGECIVEAGSAVSAGQTDDVFDCGGAVVLPGLVNGHTHLYSALAAGMPAPPSEPGNFHEILQFVWWRLDRALDAAAVRMSATVGALDALRCGTTTLIDHHASPGCIGGSMDEIEAGLSAVGLRGVLCYEVTERNGRDDVAAGLAENERYLTRCAASKDGRFAGLVGAHAAFTLADVDLAACVDLARRYQTGVHIHVAEDPCDDAICRERYGRPLLARLAESGILTCDSILGHGTHLSADDLAVVNRSSASVAHNPRSNMNNRVGYAPVDQIDRPLLLGTDGIGGDMFAELRAAWFKHRDARLALPPQRFVAMLAENARAAGRRLGVRLGELGPSAAADIVVTDSVPATPLNEDNLAAHLIFAIGARHVKHVFVSGRARMIDRGVVGLDEPALRREATGVARDLWERMRRFP